MLGFKSITGLTQSQAVAGLVIAAIPGDTGIGPSIIVLQAEGSGLPPSDASINITLAPGGHVGFGSDNNGNISATITLFNSGDDKTFAISGGGGNLVFPHGVWASLITGTVNYLFGTRGFDIQFTTLEKTDFTQSLVDAPTNPNHTNDSWDSVKQQGQTDLSFTYTNASSENPDAFAINRSFNGGASTFVGSVPRTNGVTAYTYTDYVFEAGTYTYTFQAYKYGAPDIISPESASINVVFSGTNPDINVTMDLNMDMGFASTMLFITDPSGIYTLIPDQDYDRLYQRTTDTFLDVAIPTPFIKTALVGE